MEDQKVLEVILKAIVHEPDAVQIERTTDDRGVLLTVKLAEGDAGGVIGKSGETINVIRRIISVVGAVNRSNVSIKLDIPERTGGSGGGERRGYEGSREGGPRRSVDESIGSEA